MTVQSCLLEQNTQDEARFKRWWRFTKCVGSCFDRSHNRSFREKTSALCTADLSFAAQKPNSPQASSLCSFSSIAALTASILDVESSVPSSQFVSRREVLGRELELVKLPCGISRRVYKRVLAVMERLPKSALVLIMPDAPGIVDLQVCAANGVCLRKPLNAHKHGHWVGRRRTVFDEFTDDELEDWCADGAVAVRPSSGRILGVTLRVDAPEDPRFVMDGGMRTAMAFNASRHGGILAVSKKLKDTGHEDVITGWTSVFVPALTAQEPPIFLRCAGKHGIDLSLSELRQAQMRARGSSASLPTMV